MSEIKVRPVGHVKSVRDAVDSAPDARVPDWVAELMRGYFDPPEGG